MTFLTQSLPPLTSQNMNSLATAATTSWWTPPLWPAAITSAATVWLCGGSLLTRMNAPSAGRSGKAFLRSTYCWGMLFTARPYQRLNVWFPTIVFTLFLSRTVQWPSVTSSWHLVFADKTMLLYQPLYKRSCLQNSQYHNMTQNTQSASIVLLPKHIYLKLCLQTICISCCSLFSLTATDFTIFSSRFQGFVLGFFLCIEILALWPKHYYCLLHFPNMTAEWCCGIWWHDYLHLFF